MLRAADDGGVYTGGPMAPVRVTCGAIATDSAPVCVPLLCASVGRAGKGDEG